MTSTPFDLSLGLEDTHVLVTGGCGLIGRVIVQAFLSAGSRVSVLDLPGTEHSLNLPDNPTDNLKFVPCDITKDLDSAFTQAERHYGPVRTCIALASLDLSSLPQTESLCDANPEVWNKVFDVNLNGTFLTCQRWLQGLRHLHRDSLLDTAQCRNISCIIIGSESGRFGVRTMPAYAAAKSAVQQGLLLSLAQDAPRVWPGARVNAVAPGAVDTERFAKEAEMFGRQWRWMESEATVPLRRPVPVEDVARAVLFLASQRWSGSVHGQCLAVDGGKTGAMVWPEHEG